MQKLMVVAAALVFAAVASAQCRDPWVSQAVQQVLGRNASGSADSGECAPANYGGGQWSSFPDLVEKVATHFQVCRDPWIRAAVQQVTGRAPQGYADYGECSPSNYTGTWSSYQDLYNKVYAHFHPPAPPARAVPQSMLGSNAGFVGQNGSAIVAAGGGNLRPGAGIVAAGGGNIVAAGGGNFSYRGGDDFKAAGQGDAQAMYHVGQSLAADGKDQNLPEAYKWLSLASMNGVAEAADDRKTVKAKLTPEQLREEDAAIKNWKPIPAETASASAGDNKDEKK